MQTFRFNNGSASKYKGKSALATSCIGCGKDTRDGAPKHDKLEP